MTTYPKRNLKLAACLGLALLMAACADSEKKRPLTQVAAKVDGEEISIHQLNAVIAREGFAGTEGGELNRRVLERLIDQQVLVSQAVEAKLDRDPNVLLRMDLARREILSQAYLEKQLAGLSQPAPGDVHAYYQANPALFAERRIYDLQEIRVQATPEIKKDLEQLVESHRSFDEMRRYIADRGVKYQIVEAVRPAEQLPLEVLPRLAELKDKEIGLIESEGLYSLVHVRSSRRAPITEATAKPAIEAYLAGIKRQKVVAEEVKRMREGAKVEYLGMFAEAPTTTAKQ